MFNVDIPVIFPPSPTNDVAVKMPVTWVPCANVVTAEPTNSPVTSPVKSPVTFPVTSPVKSPVKSQ